MYCSPVACLCLESTTLSCAVNQHVPVQGVHCVVG